MLKKIIFIIRTLEHPSSEMCRPLDKKINKGTGELNYILNQLHIARIHRMIFYQPKNTRFSQQCLEHSSG